MKLTKQKEDHGILYMVLTLMLDYVHDYVQYFQLSL